MTTMTEGESAFFMRAILRHRTELGPSETLEDAPDPITVPRRCFAKGGRCYIKGAMPPSPPASDERRDDPRARAIARLRALGASLENIDRLTSDRWSRPRVVAFASRARQRCLQDALEVPWIVVILEGRKRIDSHDNRMVSPGDVLLLPTRSPLTVTNFPDPASGHYQALCVEVIADAHAAVRRHHPDLAPLLGSWFGPQLEVVRAGPAALHAFAHVCEAMLDATSHPRLLHHCLEGLLLALLLERTTATTSLAPAQAKTDLVLAVKNIVRAEPDASLRAELVARRLGVGTATLRRRLALAGTNLRTLIRDERMALARVLLSDGRLGVAEVALRCGYESAAKFARQFNRTFGQAPSAARARPRRVA